MPNLWTYEQKFNGLNDGDLNGQDDWSAESDTDVVQTGTPYEGAKHVIVSGSATRQRL